MTRKVGAWVTLLATSQGATEAVGDAPGAGEALDRTRPPSSSQLGNQPCDTLI